MLLYFGHMFECLKNQLHDTWKHLPQNLEQIRYCHERKKTAKLHTSFKDLHVQYWEVQRLKYKKNEQYLTSFYYSLPLRVTVILIFLSLLYLSCRVCKFHAHNWFFGINRIKFLPFAREEIGSFCLSHSEFDRSFFCHQHCIILLVTSGYFKSVHVARKSKTIR